MENLRVFFGISLLLSEAKFCISFAHVFVLPNASRGSGHQMFWIIVFLKDLFKAASGPPSPENISSIICFKATSGWMQKSIATF
jgi:hypothetical protein